MLKLDHDFRGGQVPAARPQRDAARTLSRLLSQLISYAGNTTKKDENKLVEIRLRKSPDTIQSVTVANIRSGPHRFRLSSLRNSPDSALTLPKSPDMAFRTEYYDGSRLGPALLAPPFSELSSFGLNQSRAVVSVVPGSPGAPTTNAQSKVGEPESPRYPIRTAPRCSTACANKDKRCSETRRTQERRREFYITLP